MEWYRFAATQGHADSQVSLGLCYENAIGVEKDIKKAVALYQLAAAQGHALAQRKLSS
jgi:hypothetical protein